MLYAIGDIHGRLDKLDALLDMLPLRPGDRLVFLGDYVDRGPDSRGVVDRLVDLADAYPCEFLLGNHESMFLDYLGWKGDAFFGADVFLPNGGAETSHTAGTSARSREVAPPKRVVLQRAAPPCRRRRPLHAGLVAPHAQRPDR
jgi:hypothetical protein